MRFRREAEAPFSILLGKPSKRGLIKDHTKVILLDEDSVGAVYWDSWNTVLANLTLLSASVIILTSRIRVMTSIGDRKSDYLIDVDVDTVFSF